MRHLIKKPLNRFSTFIPPFHKRHIKTCLSLLFVIVFLLLSGCTNDRETQTPDISSPTTTPTPEQIIFPEFLNPTDQNFATEESALIIDFKPKIFTHSDNLFSLNISETWQTEESQYGARITDPQNDLAINVVIVNTGYTLSEESFKNFIDIQEENKSADFSEYMQIENHDLAKENSIPIDL